MKRARAVCGGVIAAASLASCTNPVMEGWTFPEAELSLRWTAHGTPVANARVDVRGFPAAACGAPGTAEDFDTFKLDAAGRHASRIYTNPPVDTITRCVTVHFFAPYQSGARDTVVTVGDVTFRWSGRHAPLDSINVVIIQP
jgi:hypothetical protein